MRHYDMPDISLLFPLLSLAAVLGFIPLARKAALRIGHVDRPGGRKDHDRPTPPVGGLVILPVFILASLLSRADIAQQWPLWAGLLVILMVNYRDFTLMVNAQTEARRREAEQSRLLHMIDDMPVAVMTVEPGTFAINYAKFWGGDTAFDQPLGDRDFVGAYLSRNF